MPHYWIPNSTKEVKQEILKETGVDDVEEFFKDIPEQLRLKKELRVGFGKPLLEHEARRKFLEILSKNKFTGFRDVHRVFLGGGVCVHYIPSVVRAIVSRAEFYTAYTPYQPEINQGILQAFFEYQSLMAELYGVDIVNASMYNVSTAAAEAVRMALRVKRGRKRILIASSAHPEIKEVIRTWVKGLNVRLEEIPYEREDGELDVNVLRAKLSDDVAAVYVESPNFFGIIERKLRDIIEITHDAGALAIVNANPLSLGVFKAPGELGADIVVGDAQPLGVGLNYGGPSAGILGIQDRKELLRQLPGRLVGMTKTVDGSENGFMLILQTREQHIRRERATSNITTNSGLEAIAAAVYVSLLGAKGLKRLGEALLGRTTYFLETLRKRDIKAAPLFEKGLYFREVTISFKGRDARDVISQLEKHGIHVGPPLSRFYDVMHDCSLLCLTELHSKDDIDELVSKLALVLGGETG